MFYQLSPSHSLIQFILHENKYSVKIVAVNRVTTNTKNDYVFYQTLHEKASLMFFSHVILLTFTSTKCLKIVWLEINIGLLTPVENAVNYVSLIHKQSTVNNHTSYFIAVILGQGKTASGFYPRSCLSSPSLRVWKTSFLGKNPHWLPMTLSINWPCCVPKWSFFITHNDPDDSSTETVAFLWHVHFLILCRLGPAVDSLQCVTVSMK